MADEKAKPPTDAGTADQVKAYDARGEKITIDRSEIGRLYALGGRLAKKDEVAAAQLEAEYEAQSTAKKALGYAKFAGPAGAIANLAMGGGTAAPELEAYREGTGLGVTAGLSQGVTRQAIEATQGRAAAEQYAGRMSALQTAHPGLTAAGEVAGTVAGAFMGGEAQAAKGLARVIPGAGISALGGAIEQGVGRVGARVLGEQAAKSVAGRAAISAAEFGTRGAVEGALFGAGQTVGDALLHDHELAAEKLYAAVGNGALYGGVGGALLGGAGSLAASGVRRGVGALAESAAAGRQAARTAAEDAAGAIRAAGEDAVTAGRRTAEEAAGALRNAGEEAAFRGEQAAVGAVNDAAREAVTAGRAVEEATGLGTRLRNAATPQKVTEYAQEQAWRSIGAGQGLQSTNFAKRADKYLGGTKNVGEVLLRRGVIDTGEGVGFARAVVNAGSEGTPGKLLPKIEAELETVGQRIGEITNTSGARIEADSVAAALDRVAKKYEATAATRPVGRSVRSFSADLLDSLGLREAGATASVQDALKERRAIDRLVFQDAPTVDPKLALEAKRELRTALEDIITETLDKNSGKVSGELAAEYKALKRDYTALSIAAEAAEDSAARMSKNRILSPTDYGAAAMSAMGGNLLAAPVAAVGHKMLRERGNAMAAVALKRMADRDILGQWVQKLDGQINKASKGLLVEPPKGTPRPAEKMPPAKDMAKTALSRVAEYQANPQQFIDRATRQTEGIAAHSPELASAIASQSVRAIAFLASKVPQPPEPDPLDPRPAPQLTPGEQAELARYAWYAEKPSRFFAEVARGKLTYEGAETAQALMPRAFAELQQQTLDQLTTMMAKGERLPFRQRQILGVLLDMATTPSQFPEHARFLQGNLEPLADTPPPPPPPRRSMGSGGMKAPQSALDRLEERGAGR